VIFVISGLQSEAARAEEAEGIANWAFRQFVQKTIAPAGKVFVDAPVWMGAAPTVGLMTQTDIDLLIPAEALRTASAEVVYDGPLEAPITKGQQIATLVVTRGEMDKAFIPLVADKDVAAGGFGKRIGTAAQVLIGRMSGDAGLF
jgi:D-alanyl-D-alanine carboxypeptidase (penicillin-binding protein 5/6)